MKHWLALFILTFLIAGCTESAEPIEAHQAAKPYDSGTDTVVPDDDPALSAKAKEWADAAAPGTDVLGEVIVPAAARVLKMDVVKDKNSLSNTSVIQELAKLNELIVREYRAKPDDSRWAAIFADYSAALSFECDTVRAACTGFKYFKLSANSAEVAKILARRDQSRYYFYLHFAAELKGSLWDGELITMFVAGLDSLQSQTQQKYLSAARSRVETALLSAERRFTSQAELRTFLNDAKIWKLLENTSITLGAATRNALYAMIIRSGALLTQNGAATAEFQKQIAAQSKLPIGLMARQEFVRKQTILNAKAIGFAFEDQMDSISYAFDALVTGQLSEENTTELLLALKLSPEVFEQRLVNYVRIRFAAALVESTVKAKELFDAKVPIQNRMSHAISGSLTIRGTWTTLTQSILPLRMVLSSYTKRANSPPELTQNLTRLFDSIGKSINLAATYPHMFALFHQLAQKDFALWSYDQFGKPRKYRSGELIHMLILGQTAPIFPYSDDTRALNEYEVLHAFDMAVRGSVFPIAGIDVDVFISDTLKRISEREVSHLDQLLDIIEQRFASTSEEARRLDAICQEFSAQPKLLPRSFSVEHVIDSPYLGKFHGRIFASNFEREAFRLESKTGIKASFQGGVFFPELQLAEGLERTRTELNNQIRIGETLLASYRDYLTKYESCDGVRCTNEQADTKTALSRARLDELRALRDRMIRNTRSLFARFGECYGKLYQRDMQVRDSLMVMEQAYFRQIHRDIKRLRSGTLNSEQINQIRERHRVRASNFVGLDELRPDGYVMNRADYILRTGNFLTRGLTTDEKAYEAPASHLTMEYAEKYDHKSTLVQLQGRRLVQFTEDETTFVNEAIKHVLIYNGFYSTTEMGMVSNIRDLMHTTVNAYRLDQVTNGANAVLTADTVMRIFDQFLTILKLPEDRQKIFEINKQGTFFTLTYLEKQVFSLDQWNRFRVARTWGMYDLPGVLINRDYLGYNYEFDFMSSAGPDGPITVEPRFGYPDQARVYYSTRSKGGRGASLVPYNKVLDTNMDVMVRHQVKTELDAAEGLHAKAAEYARAALARDVEDQPKIDLSMTLSYSRPLLEPHIYDEFTNKKQRLDQDTAGCLLKETCEDFE